MNNKLDVLIVDDEVGLADLYAAWIDGEHEVETAYTGEEALEKVDVSTDIVFLDRRMPGLSGDEVLARIRRQKLDCRVAMVTAVDADFDILEMPFDAYLSKPVSETDFHETIDRLARRAEYDDAVQEYFSLVSRQVTLQTEKRSEELDASDEYISLVEEIEILKDQLDSITGQLDEEDIISSLKGI